MDPKLRKDLEKVLEIYKILIKEPDPEDEEDAQKDLLKIFKRQLFFKIERDLSTELIKSVRILFNGRSFTLAAHFSVIAHINRKLFSARIKAGLKSDHGLPIFKIKKNEAIFIPETKFIPFKSYLETLLLCRTKGNSFCEFIKVFFINSKTCRCVINDTLIIGSKRYALH